MQATFDENSAKEISRLLVARLAADELPVFERVHAAVARELSSDKSKHPKTDPLGSGLGELITASSLVTTVLIAVGTWIAKDLVGKSVQEVYGKRLTEALRRASGVAKNEAAVSPRALSADEYRYLASLLEVARSTGDEFGISGDVLERVMGQLPDVVTRALSEVPVVEKN